MFGFEKDARLENNTSQNRLQMPHTGCGHCWPQGGFVYQRARDFARERKQGSELGSGSRDKVAIVRHPDVRRMLLQMKTRTEALRAVACAVASATDIATTHSDAAVRREKQAFVDLMIPVVKGWSTETSVFVTSLGVQIHGGMGYVEETGAAQHWRDSRITPIYEGTTGIQAADLAGRKIARDGGEAATKLTREMEFVQQKLESLRVHELASIAAQLGAGIAALRRCVGFVVERHSSDAKAIAAGAVPLLELFGIVAGGWQMARAALVAHERLAQGGGDAGYLKAKLLSAKFYADHVLTQADGLARTVVTGSGAILDYEDEQF
ncbi:acyl-CoA dehydrogenase [Hydrogenophaga sp. 2FB]|uniref:acyl-CoA dehydrogenase n=1 Tax=Hydrogenophaga sp. 2FB TaxID=2502187 RepID=UPI00207B9FD1|nr:acyl-CoA dehydrogenase [Hydrogenophaga sp. 2FB]